jgi:DMSO/TMAO reductase YedYZ molybdopterin-dependent catalytic subunit
MRAASQRICRFLSTRRTNTTLLIALLIAFATGIGAVSNGTSSGRWVVVGHGVAAMLVIVLIPWKTQVVRHGLRRKRGTRWISIVLLVVTAATLTMGIAHSTGLVRSVAGLRSMWLHVVLALAILPFVLWHVAARKRSHRTDLSRRALLRAGALVPVAAGLYVVADSAVRLAHLPGAGRRFTGSYEDGSFNPASMPQYIWLNDTTPTVDVDKWRLAVTDGDGTRRLRFDDLASDNITIRATLDCTSGWYAEQYWTGIPVERLIRSRRDASSLYVHSVTGYWIRLPVHEIDDLLLATRVGGQPLRPGHGFPARLVVPNRRGYWWVKWVDRIELQTTPPWWQPPFPAT